MSETSRVSPRAEAAIRTEAPVTAVRLVDARRAEALGRLGISTVGDLLRHYPFRYLDLTCVRDLAHVPIGIDSTVVGRVHDIKVKRPRPRLTVTEVALVDGTGAIIGVWFNQPYIAQRFAVGDRVAFAGSVSMEYGLKQMRSPFTERLDPDGSDETALARILPVHRTTEAISTNWMRRLTTEALDHAGDLPDPLPARFRVRHDLMPLSAALRAIHWPGSAAEATRARRRLAYDELLAIQVGMTMRRHRLTDAEEGHAHRADGPCVRRLPDVLGFDLTGDQRSAIGDVLRDLARPHPANRMLLGDVGTGKTAVATHALAACADSGTQAAMMAPTEVLAAQYARSVGPWLDALGITWALLTGSTPGAERTRIAGDCADGAVTVLFGTHALIQGSVSFARLTLAIVDEQHRFGVTQRLALREKGVHPDLLVMSATPIPRSLALTAYGDLDTSCLRERPGGRAAGHVVTQVVDATHRAEAYAAVREAVGRDERAFIVCPLVEDSEAAEAKAATTEFKRLQGQVFPELRLGLLTGRMRSSDKDAVMSAFRTGEVQVLVTTTVIEVGVDVPEATVMIVEDAERFGLAQLHQLRGRVGRGERPAKVLLFADPKTDEGRQRMDAIAAIDDGFALAERDLALRGEGDILGFRQSGLPALRLATLGGDMDLLEMARGDAEEIVDSDPWLDRPDHAPLRRAVTDALGEAWEWVSAG